MSRLIISILSVAILSACGGNYKDSVINASEIQLGGQKAKILAGNLLSDGTSVQGIGTLLFESRYDQFQSGGSYAIDFRLADGGSLRLASHANESLNNGFEIEFLRQGKGNSSLKGKLFAQGQTWEVTNQFDAIHADDFIQLQIDVHNDESPSHIIIWNRSNGDDFSEDSAILNSAEEVDGSPGIGVGIRWGVKLNNSSLFRAEKMNPKFEE